MAVGIARPEPFAANDAIFVFNASLQTLKYFHANGMMQWHVPARGIGERSTFSKNGKTPPGLYKLGQPQTVDRSDEKAQALGLWFVPINPFIAPIYMRNNRSDIGIHGGGSDLRAPLAPRQGWEATKGCIRVQNADLPRVANAVRNALQKGHDAWLTVTWLETVDGRQVSIGF